MEVPNRVQVLKVNWAKHNGFVYRPGLVICGKVKHAMPLFYQIDSVLIIHEELLFLTLPLCTVTFQEHFHAYEVTTTKKDYVGFNVNNMQYPRPFDIQMSYGVNDTALFVVPYCYLW
jgi:hypothetical protein